MIYHLDYKRIISKLFCWMILKQSSHFYTMNFYVVWVGSMDNGYPCALKLLDFWDYPYWNITLISSQFCQHHDKIHNGSAWKQSKIFISYQFKILCNEAAKYSSGFNAGWPKIWRISPTEHRNQLKEIKELELFLKFFI